jgi:membrane protein
LTSGRIRLTVGKLRISLYLGKSAIGSSYAAGPLVVRQLWIYYSAQILSFGARLPQTCADRHRANVA